MDYATHRCLLDYPLQHILGGFHTVLVENLLGQSTQAFLRYVSVLRYGASVHKCAVGIKMFKYLITTFGVAHRV